MTAADDWLQHQLDALYRWHLLWDDAGEALVAPLAGVAALEAAGVLSPEAADTWRGRLEREAARPREPDRYVGEPATDSTEAELLQVLTGPDEPRGGYRLLLLLRFADGVVCQLDKDDAEDDDWPEWILVDATGTVYDTGGEGGSDTDVSVAFSPGVPDGVGWVELRLGGRDDVVFRVRT
ncbi:hypothetical protein C8N24_0045 [Solirubrobacter pauli]|uniref:Uncharacterized protein n=1 Tax=Solirubrobacter pauli TaxID=166793 RepID=A0A660L782_9ACTN|nr:hypothetical protein [Solirubrobacter pauli]RKQ90246.1 hypothetical protein C8N24_0045 [Solirubrobacter pauli]